MIWMFAEEGVSTLSPKAAIAVGIIIGVITFGLATARERRDRR